MIDHLSLAVGDLEKSAAFYDGVLAPLGLTRLVTRAGSVGFGKSYPEFWLNARTGLAPQPDRTGSHVALRAPSEEAVRVFHAAALAAGGRDDGTPGPRRGALTTYYGAFILDPDGNKIEALHFPKGAR
jgi:catechol 2,3-dioxygenase-like lactoylglutathione lyase family enzyme